LPTSEKAGNLIAKRPEQEFSERAATIPISAETVVDDLAWQRLQWAGDRSLAGRFR
jgi:hypothetical protein